MHRFLAWAMLGCVPAAIPAPAAQAASPIIGVNAYGANLDDMAANGVKTLRISLFPNSVDFVVDAYRHGISSVVIVYPFTGASIKWQGPWGAAPLSRLDPQEFIAGVTPLLNKLEAAGVRLAAIELGNEPNGGGFNGDIASPGSGRVLGLADLNNPNDAEARPIAAGFRVYVKIMAALKDIRDHSKHNQQTPIITAGMANWGPPRAKAFNNGGVAVSLTDNIEFLRQNGIDKYVDGYGVHVYPDADLRKPVVTRIASLEQLLFAACTRAKPCWLTEWGVGNADQSCPAKDAARRQVIGTIRDAFKHFVDEGRLSALIYYAWVGVPGNKIDGSAIWRCGSLTEAGRLALSPM